MLSRWFSTRHVRQRVSLFERLDSALVDAPSLCCEGDRLCAACDAESAPWLTRAAHLAPLPS